jgi:DNA-binding transcriptional ArsR family regulator
VDAKTVELAREQAEICRLFGNANRILILWALARQEMSVTDIAEAIDSSIQNTSQHLRLMKDRGVLETRREGHTIYYRVKGHALLEGCGIMLQATSEVP